jgi:hypothetical protein
MIKFEFKQMPQVIAAVRNAMALLADMTPVYLDIKEYMIEATRKRFVEGKDPGRQRMGAQEGIDAGAI